MQVKIEISEKATVDGACSVQVFFVNGWRLAHTRGFFTVCPHERDRAGSMLFFRFQISRAIHFLDHCLGFLGIDRLLVADYEH